MRCLIKVSSLSFLSEEGRFGLVLALFKWIIIRRISQNISILRELLGGFNQKGGAFINQIPIWALLTIKAQKLHDNS
jgi:hypothetical protein